MPSRLSQRLRSITALVALALLVGGCAAKRNLDGHVDRLVKSAWDNDYAAFQKMSVPALAEQFPRERFEALSKALHSFGPFKERTMKGIEVKTAGVRKGRYTLRFEKASVELEITLQGEKLTAFSFQGDAIMKAMTEVNQAKYSTFKTAEFQWQDASGKAKNNIYKAGTPVHFRMEVWGLKPENKSLLLRADLMVMSGPQPILNRPGFVDKPLPLAEGMPPVATLTGNVIVPNPGNYKLIMRVTDKATQRHLTHEEAFLVEAGTPEPVPAAEPEARPETAARPEPEARPEPAARPEPEARP